MVVRFTVVVGVVWREGWGGGESAGAVIWCSVRRVDAPENKVVELGRFSLHGR